MSVSKNTIEKIGHRACLREMTGQTYSIYASTSTLSRALFHGTFFGGWVFKVKIEKKRQERYKVWNVRNNLIYNLWKNQVILIEIENVP